MVKLRHRTRRDGGVKVRDTWYQLDSSGCVEVSEAHAAVMLQGAMWTKVGGTVSRPAQPAPPPPAEPVEPVERPLDAMLKSELVELARGMGLEVDDKMSKLKLVAEIRAARKEIDHGRTEDAP